MKLPLRQISPDMSQENIIVISFKQVSQFVQNNILQTNNRFLCQFKIYPDAPFFNVAGAPFGFHFPHAPVIYLYACFRFVFFNEGGYFFLSSALCHSFIMRSLFSVVVFGLMYKSILDLLFKTTLGGALCSMTFNK